MFWDSKKDDKVVELDSFRTEHRAQNNHSIESIDNIPDCYRSLLFNADKNGGIGVDDNLFS
ncbi:hypothetical protein KC906_03250 [Candidatus Kaiserbacteria bacterium]|nr:hypothetical protein [Candidatus Kaiserbacteria bacterium]MCB9812367.1 hypothetical protein [Candidatus Nomurabacteria bacterium]